jgi:hypothetical protein
MKPPDNIEQTIRRLHFEAGAKMHDRILAGALKAQEGPEKAKLSSVEANIWRIIMKSRKTKLTVAAIVIVAVMLSITLVDKSVAPAYAIEQTIEANHTVRYLHMKDYAAAHDEPKEFWIECDELGRVTNARYHMPQWDSPEDGAKVVVWKKDEVQIWFKRKNTLFIARDQSVAANMLKLAEERDPRLAVERLQRMQEQGKVKIQIDESGNKAAPIVVTATYLSQNTVPGKREVFLVDQGTKLVTAVKLYKSKNGEYEYAGVQEYYDYNQPIAAEMFSLEEIPDDVMRIDQTTQDVGLVQGQLGNEEIAVEVVRRFFEALIAQDYAKAGRLMEGIPGDRMHKELGHIRFLRIVSIGPAAPHPNPKTRGLVVPCTVEIQKNGLTSQWTLDRLGVRPVFNQPHRWTIFGGI